MAAFDTTRPIATANTAGGFLNAFTRLYGAVLAWNDARATRKALSQLSKHQLADIGLNSSADIDLFITRYR
ncbi:MAG: DUF1127 domain-containing protein [Pseudomonadota bacterium]